ncbi:hypothetical protein ES702_03418 [subsurface metagenome]
MTMVRLVLRHKDDVGLLNFGKMLNGTRNDMMGYREPLSVDNGTTG